MPNSFVQFRDTCLLFPSGKQPANEIGAAFVFLADEVPAALDFEDIVAAPGALIFFHSLPSPENIDALYALIAELKSYLHGSDRGLNKFYWFAPFDGSELTALAIPVSEGLVAQATALPLGNIVLQIAGGSQVRLSNESVGFIPRDETPHATLTTSYSGTATKTLFDGPLSLNILNGDIACFEGRQDLIEADFDGLNIGLMYVTPDDYDEGYTNFAAFRILDFAPDHAPLSIPMQVTFDPLIQGSTNRGAWRFTSTAALPTHYTNPFGVPLALSPRHDATDVSAFVVTPWPIAPPPTQSGATEAGTYYYLSPYGCFDVSDGSEPQSDTGLAGDYGFSIMPGTSGAEYFKLESSGTYLRFESGHPAYAKKSAANSNQSTDTNGTFDALSTYATTSWATIGHSGSTGVNYFSQPLKATQYQPSSGAASKVAATHMNYLEIHAGNIPDAKHFVPMTPYRGFAHATSNVTIDHALAMEKQLLAPARKTIIPKSVNQGAPSAVSGDANHGFTPQGFSLALSDGDWASLTMATTLDRRFPDFTLHNVDGDLQDAFLSSDLFLVISDAKAFERFGTYTYTLTEQVLKGLVTSKKVSAKIQALLDPQSAPKVVGTSYSSKSEFDEAVMLALISDPGASEKYGSVLGAAAASFTLSIAGWHFNLAAETWHKHGTMLLFKFTDQPLSKLVHSTSSWYRGGKGFNASPRASQEALQTFVATAKAQAATDRDMQTFVDTIADDPSWQGMLALNGDVPLSELPAQLKGLAAGINAAQFYSHHVGVRLTPLTTGAGANNVVLQQESNTFGLIHYESPKLLEAGDPYNFKVLSLKVAFENASIRSFSSRIDLYVDKLFGDAVTGRHSDYGNNLVFNGVYQKHDGVGSYVFTTEGESWFQSHGGVLANVSVDRAHFLTLTPRKNQTDQSIIHAQFLLRGVVQFKDNLPVDLFGYGANDKIQTGLAFSGLAVDMQFDIATPSYKTFSFDVGHMVFNQNATKKRQDSFVRHFPIKLKHAIGGKGKAKPSDFLPVTVAFSTSGLQSDEWYGLEYDLNLGSLGALAAHAGFTAQVLLAWCPGPAEGNQHPIFLGISLPSVKGGDLSIALEEIIKLTFGDIKLLSEGNSYILEIQNIALKLLSLKFPQSGQTSLLIFGNPKTSGSDAIGWYGGYAKNTPAKPKVSKTPTI